MADDVRAFDAAVVAGEETFPHAVVMRLHAGEHPLRVFREHRGSPRRRWPRPPAPTGNTCIR